MWVCIFKLESPNESNDLLVDKNEIDLNFS